MIKKHNGLATTISPAMGIGLLACIFILLSVITSVIVTLLVSHMANDVAAMRISIVIQDLLIFITPAVVTAIFMTRLPARFLDIESAPGIRPLLIAVITLLAALPLLNCIVAWNEGIHFPENLAGLETKLRALENNANNAIETFFVSTSPMALILSILIVGLLAGISEELFFRGALQKLLLLRNINPHIAIWLTAFIFIAIHFQFFGFIPRMILGAYFGYLVWWTRCLWIPIIVHAVNNSLVVVSKWIESRSGQDMAIETIGADPFGSTSSMIVLAISIILTVVLIVRLKKDAK